MHCYYYHYYSYSLKLQHLFKFLSFSEVGAGTGSANLMSCLLNSPCSHGMSQKSGNVILLLKTHLWLPRTFRTESNSLPLRCRLSLHCRSRPTTLWLRFSFQSFQTLKFTLLIPPPGCASVSQLCLLCSLLLGYDSPSSSVGQFPSQPSEHSGTLSSRKPSLNSQWGCKMLLIFLLSEFFCQDEVICFCAWLPG